MIKTFTLLSLAIIMTTSIIGSSLISILEIETEIGLVNDYDEESKKESKKEIEEADKFFEKQFALLISGTIAISPSNFFYQEKRYGHFQVVNSPPPKFTIS